MKLTLEKQIPLSFLIAILLLIVIIFFVSRSINSVSKSLSLQSHTQEVLLQLEEILITTLDAETNGRAFLITADPYFLEPYNQARSKVGENIAKLRKLVEDNQNQKDRIPILETAINERLDVLTDIVEKRRTKSLDEVLAQNITGRGRQKMNEVRALLDEMNLEERNLLTQRDTELNQNRNTAYGLILFAGLTGIISLGLANLAIFREIKKRRTAEDQLRDANKSLEKRVEYRTLELLQANEELKNTEEFTRSIFENSPDCVKILELDGIIHSINNNGLCNMEIDDFKEIKGKQWIDFWEGEESELAYQALQSAGKGKTAYFQGFCKTVKGSEKWWDVSVAPIFDANGKPVRLISTSRDITERKEAEKSKFHLAAIVESSNDAVISKDLNGFITSWNKGAENLFGYTADEVIGKSVTILIPPDHLDEEPQILERIRQGEKVVLYETTRMRKDKSRVEISLTISPIFDYTGKIIGASKIAHDITERCRAERERESLLLSEQSARKEAEIANRMRDEFLATVSHELRAPLNSILGWGKLLIKGNLDLPTADKAIQTIVRNAEAQNRLIEDLLDVSRIISGKLRLEIITIKPIIFVEAALETVRPAAEAKNITLEIKQDSVVSHISGDPNRLQQVIWNLLSNAIKFTPSGGKVTIEIERMNGNTEIRVKDSGVGISEEFLPHVFDRFRQADASSIRKFGGLGLGLAIVRHIVEMHGGTVSAMSSGENQGSTFIVCLPVTAAPKQEEDSEPKALVNNLTQTNAPKLTLDGLLILVVDDEEDTRQLLVQSLTFYGATVITAKSATEGLSALQEKNPDVLVSDIGMPDEDGYSLIRKVRSLENKHQKNVVAVALTAFTRSQDRMRALSSGFQNHVGKPVELDELATVIASLTGRLRAD